MIIDPRTLKNHLAAGDAGRYRLDCLALTDDGILSTDGHSLLLSRYPRVVMSEAPKIDNLDATSPVPSEPVLLSVDCAKKAAAMVGRTKAGDPEFAGLLQVECAGDKIKFGSGVSGASQTMTTKAAVGQYPPVGGVIPDYSDSVVVSVEIDVLLKSLKSLKGSTDKQYVAIRVVDGDTAVGFSCEDGTAVLVMPISIGEDEEHIPDALAKLRSDEGRVRELPNRELDPELKEEPEPKLAEVASEPVADTEPAPEPEPAPVEESQADQPESAVPVFHQDEKVSAVSNAGKRYQPSPSLAAIIGG